MIIARIDQGSSVVPIITRHGWSGRSGHWRANISRKGWYREPTTALPSSRFMSGGT